MRTVLADKMFYFKGVKYTGCFNHKSVDYLLPWSKVNNITYDYETNLTKFNFNNNIIDTKGNTLLQVVEILNRPYTNGVIIEDETIKEMF
jgi:hypothetical protein